MTRAEIPALTREKAAETLCAARCVQIFIHRSPDGDAVGSAAALARLLLQMGKEARIVCADPVPHRLAFLTAGLDVCREPAAPEEGTLRAALDTASEAQLGALSPLAETIALSVDHHGTGEPWCPHCTDGTAAACGEIVAGFYDGWLGAGLVRPDAAVARALYAAIASDTGGFRYSNTTPETHRTAARLLEEIRAARDGGDDAAMLCHRLFESCTMKEWTAKRVAAESLVVSHGGRIGAVVFTRKMMADNGLGEEEISDLVDLPRSLESVRIALFIRQRADDPCAWRVSARANGEFDVAAVCARFGGGGHKRAAGCTVFAADADAARETVLAAFAAALPDEDAL